MWTVFFTPSRTLCPRCPNNGHVVLQTVSTSVKWRCTCCVESCVLEKLLLIQKSKNMFMYLFYKFRLFLSAHLAKLYCWTCMLFSYILEFKTKRTAIVVVNYWSSSVVFRPGCSGLEPQMSQTFSVRKTAPVHVSKYSFRIIETNLRGTQDTWDNSNHFNWEFVKQRLWTCLEPTWRTQEPLQSVWDIVQALQMFTN